MDFYEVATKKTNSSLEVYPEFQVSRSKDLMVRGKSFYAVWDEEQQMWSTDEYLVQKIVDNDLANKRSELKASMNDDVSISVKYLRTYSNGGWTKFQNFVKSISDNSKQLDEKLTFANTKVKKTDYVSKRLGYSLEPGDYAAYEEMMSTLYSPEERAKIEWAIGSIVSGDSKDIQKFFVFYGDPGSGKSTVLNIIQSMFDQYTVTFDAKALTNSNNQFATEVFRSNPLVAIQHDGDLSRIEDNTKLNSIVSHENMPMNEKYKASYEAKTICMLFMATNKPVKIPDGKSGLIRRLIDIHPSGNKVTPRRYRTLMDMIQYEYGAIAYHCLEVYKSMGKNYYNDYIPMDMMSRTDPFFNFVKEQYDIFSQEDGVSLKSAWEMYKIFAADSNLDYLLKKFQFRDELKNYFERYEEVKRIGDKQVRNWYSGFKHDKFKEKLLGKEDKDENKEPEVKASLYSLKLDCDSSILDEMLKDCPAQYASRDKNEVPLKPWSDVHTTLNDISTKRVHYVKVPENHIVIDFDLKDENGNKSQELNLEAASKFYPTYAEFSKGGAGVHLHYIYDSDPNLLSRVYSEGIEIKVFTGNSALRRRLSKCNNLNVAHISGGLPLKEVKMLNPVTIRTEKALRGFIAKNLRKEIHPATKPSIDFIKAKLDEVYAQGLKYDVSDMRSDIFEFACMSTHNSDYCIKQVGEMKFKSEEPSISVDDEKPIAFFDIEVFPNLLLVNWKLPGKDKLCSRMINPSAADIEQLVTSYRLIGFNNRRYDNIILYARMLGYSNEGLFNLSQEVINGGKGSDIEKQFSEARNLSYTDIYDFASAGNKKSLKKFEIELGIHHQELGMPWDQPVPESKWEEVAKYCDNDVIATEAVFEHLKGDWTARQMLAAIAGGSVNDTTNSLSTKFIFGSDKTPQDFFYYRNLAEPVSHITPEQKEFYDLYFQDMIKEPHIKNGISSVLPFFPGYVFDSGKSTYRNMEAGEGGFVWAKPGMYWNVVTFDVASMHPHSVLSEFLFGKYCYRFIDILQARIAIKHKEFDKAKTMLDGTLAPYLNDEDSSKAVSNALKTVINSVYGLTAAKFQNKFKDPRNIDNIVAKRGALFMIDLLYSVQEHGGEVIHIKTDSIKVVNPSKDICDLIIRTGLRHGYKFEIEHKFEKICLVNDAVYIAKMAEDDEEWLEECAKAEKKGLPKPTRWTATGAQFAHPYVFKMMFEKSPIRFEDMCETKTVSSALYLDFNENLGEDEHNYMFVGKAGSFCPVKPGTNGGILCREKDGKYNAAGGTKGYRWMEAEVLKNLKWDDKIDRTYFNKLVDVSVETIEKFGPIDAFLDEELDDIPPWLPPCGSEVINGCESCSYYKVESNGKGHCEREFIIHQEWIK